eukprot:3459897-Prymnesium_polylepis.1
MGSGEGIDRGSRKHLLELVLLEQKRLDQRLEREDLPGLLVAAQEHVGEAASPEELGGLERKHGAIASKAPRRDDRN